MLLKDSEFNFWTYEEFKIFINTVTDRKYYIIFNFLYFTGLRTGEMIALTWNDIDLDKKTLKINKTFTNKSENEYYSITSPKTKNSIRTIDIDDNLLNLLIELYDYEKKIYKFNNDFFVFGNIKHLGISTLRRHLKENISFANDNIEEEKKLKHITLHGFRHSHVSLLINLGCDSRDVAERIGDTVRTVEETYYHMFPEKKSHTVNVLNNLKNIKNKR